MCDKECSDESFLMRHIKGQIWRFDPYSEGACWLCLWEAFCWHGLGPLFLLEWRVTTHQSKLVVSDHLHPVMMHFYPDGRSFFQKCNVPIHRAWRVTEWFDEDGNNVNHMLCPPSRVRILGKSIPMSTEAVHVVGQHLTEILKVFPLICCPSHYYY